MNETALKIFRLIATAVTIVGCIMLGLIFVDWQNGVLGPQYFPDVEHTATHHLYGLLLGLPVPLHVIFVGLIVRKRWLSPLWAKVAWVGVSSSGVWLGISLTIRAFAL